MPATPPVHQPSAAAPPFSAAALAHQLAQPRQTPHAVLRALIERGLDRLPLPGAGATLERWRMLALVAGHDLSLLKLYEGHTDALAILAELGGPTPPAGSSWGVWCAEPPDARVTLRRAHDGTLRLTGRKAWCSGAAGLSHALVSCRDEDGQRCLAAVALRQPGVHITDDGWHAVGMAACASVDVAFDEAPAQLVGAPGAYLTRPGFWHGGAGIAACWYGAARTLADYLREQLRREAAQAQSQARAGGEVRPADPHRLAHMGQVDVALVNAAALLRESADAIDAAPAADAAALAMRLRLAVEAAAHTIHTCVTRALGAGPLCRDPDFARMAADLPVFLRQSHAERDLAALGAVSIQLETDAWTL